MSSDTRVAPRTEQEDEYLQNVRLIEELEENQTGSDKSWVERAIDEFGRHYEKSVRIR